MILGWIDLGAWLITLAELATRLDSAFDIALAVIGLIGAGSAAAWLRRGHRWRAAVLAGAVLYLVYYFVRLYVVDVEPLLAIMPLPDAVADAIYVIWSWPMGRLSHGEVLDAAAALWRESVMPLLQIGVIAAAARGR